MEIYLGIFYDDVCCTYDLYVLRTVLNFIFKTRLENRIIQYWEQMQTAKIPGKTEGSGMVQNMVLQNVVLFFIEDIGEIRKGVGK